MNKYSNCGRQKLTSPNRKKVLLMISLSLFMVAIISIGTYAIWSSELLTGNNSITTGQVKMSYTESNEIGMDNALPIKDEEGKLLTNYFDFQVLSYIKTRANDSTQRKLNYNIILEPITVDNPLSDSEIKIYLTKVENGTETVVVEPTTIEKLNNKVLSSKEETFSNNKSEVVTNYRLRVWIDESVDTNRLNEKKYSYKFRVNINNEAVPVKKDYALEFVQANVGKNGLEEITHEIDDTLQVDSRFATEYRYRGGNVNNYVTFNNETWRIIGIIPTEDTDGNVENRFKIVKDESIGNYDWDSAEEIAYNYNKDESLAMMFNEYSISSNDVNNLIDYSSYYDIIKTAPDPFLCTECGNNWARPATLNTYLNGAYYNSLSEIAKSMIGATKYYLGGNIETSITSDAIWQYERKKVNDTSDTYYYDTIMQNDASKKIALMYASDYGYAASKKCTNNLYEYNSSANCITSNNWLDKSQFEWLLTPTSAAHIASLETDGKIYDSSYNVSNEVRPVLTLSSNVKISNGSGTSSDPYLLLIN